MAISSFQARFSEALVSASEYEEIELREAFEVEINDAREFAKLPGDEDSLRQFMVNYQYSEYSDLTAVTDEEIAEFREFSQPRLEQIEAYAPSFEEWQAETIASIEQLSTFDLMTESLGWIDILFQFFGVGTAYRLAAARS